MWRPIVVVATATALLFVLGLNALGWRPGTIQVTEVSGDVGPLNDLADLAHEALTSIARFVPGVGFYSALTDAFVLLVLGLGQLRSVLQARRTVGAPVVARYFRRGGDGCWGQGFDTPGISQSTKSGCGLAGHDPTAGFVGPPPRRG
jgi:hypothetical protein